MSNQEPISPDQKLRRSSRELFWAIATRCHGKTLVLGRGEGHLAKAIKDQKLDVIEVNISGLKVPQPRPEYSSIPFIQCNIDELTLPEEGFRTVVLAEVIQEVSGDTRTRILSKAWELLRLGGRLIVGVPNRDCLTHHHYVGQLNRRSLERLLQPLGKPNLVTEQPFKWLLMYVTKGENNRRELSHSNRARFRVTAKLCYGKVIELG